MDYSAGDIVLIRFPRSDLEEGKYRPVLLLNKLPGPFQDWLLCAITSQIRHEIQGWDEIITQSDNDFKESGLKATSLIRIGKLATINESIFEGKLGEISPQRLRRIRTKLSKQLSPDAN